MFRIAERRKAILLPWHAKLAAVFAHAETYIKNGKQYLIVPHGIAETRLLNNLKLDVPAPILSQYDWCCTTPFDAQRTTAAMLTMNKRGYVLNEIGTGKTRAALFAVDFLMNEGEINRTVIVAPLSTLTPVWDREIFTYFPHRTSRVIYGPREKRLIMMQDKVDFYIINTDGVRVKALLNCLVHRNDIDCIIIDELAMFRNSQTERWKGMNRLVGGRKYVWGLTGSPTPQAPTDAFGQIKLLTPSTLPVPYFSHFKQLTMTQISQFKWVPKSNANEIIHKAMQPAVRFQRAECFDIPPVLVSERSSPLTVEQQRAYNEMYADMVIRFAGNTEKITAANAGVQLSKLLQIGAGFAYGKNGAVLEINYKNRFDTLLEILEEAEKKVIVYLPFIHGVDRLHADLLKQGYTVSKVYGDTPKNERDLIFSEFQQAENPKVLVAHPKCMSHGLTLTSANVIVWFSPTVSREYFEQAEGRISRAGQDTQQLVIRIIDTPADRKVFASLDRRGSAQSALLELFEEST